MPQRDDSQRPTVGPRHAVSRPGTDDMLCTLSGETPVHSQGTVSLTISLHDLQVRRTHDQIEIELAEDVAVHIATALFDIVGQMSALRSMQMMAEAEEDSDTCLGLAAPPEKEVT